MFSIHRFILGAVLGAGLAALYLHYSHSPHGDITAHHDTAEVHLHADFIMAVRDERINMQDPKYMSGAEQELHDDVHFHDGNHDVIHVHAADITLTTFLASLGHTLTEDCLTLDTGTTYCSTDTETLTLYVNGEARDTITDYVMADADQVLLYYGEPTPSRISAWQSEISDTACIYSYTCPERGTPPPESCGLTCEL